MWALSGRRKVLWVTDFSVLHNHYWMLKLIQDSQGIGQFIVKKRQESKLLNGSFITSTSVYRVFPKATKPYKELILKWKMVQVPAFNQLDIQEREALMGTKEANSSAWVNGLRVWWGSSLEPLCLTQGCPQGKLKDYWSPFSSTLPVLWVVYLRGTLGNLLVSHHPVFSLLKKI